ncbi:uncharacterized protein LOC123534129 isoform X2 [Mercenaria mercenaria]|uniref:uncharacterized protein LOC123534129 isoform X2 n=1 Tax=Mercenaria mercenaria TaxID=6596 RepID=UPI00234E4839|nr:uncharacterized protein LOC123534129 isoform X2 [Mercenaria mercenaria]
MTKRDKPKPDLVQILGTLEVQNPKPMPLLTPREILYICTSCTARNDRTKCANLTAHSSLHQMINHRDAGSKKTPLGINKLYNIMRDMKAEAGIENPRITPYSSRKHLVQTLNDAGVPANQIMQISGHKNVNSINNYSKINNDQSRNISKILSNQRNETNLQTQGSGAASAPEPWTGPFGSNRSRSLFASSTFHGPVTFNFHSTSVSETLSQMSTVNVGRSNATAEESVSNMLDSPVATARPFKRIRMIPESDSD